MSFIKRIDYERTILKILNSYFEERFFLHGLTEAAIFEWKQRCNPPDQIVKYLLILALKLKKSRATMSYGILVLDDKLPSLIEVKDKVRELISISRL